MKKTPTLTGCASCGVSRRGFLTAGCGACAGMAGLLASPRAAGAAKAPAKPRIRIVYSLHAVKQPGPDWPNVGFDFGPVMERITAALTSGCPDIEFLTAMANGRDEAEKILSGDASAEIDGYVVYQLNCWNQVVQTMASSGKPVPLRRLPVRRKRRIPRVHGGFPAQRRPEPRLRGLLAHGKTCSPPHAASRS